MTAPSRLDADHAARVARHDPLSGVQPLDGRRRPFFSEGLDAVVLLDVHEADPTSSASLWSALRVARLAVRAATDTAAADLLPVLRHAVAAAPADLEVHVTVAARDLPLVRPLLDAGFAAATVMSVRRSAPPTAPAPVPGLVVRPATLADAAAVTEQRVRLQAFESRVSLTPVRPDAAEVLARSVDEQLRDLPGWSWLAERDGEVVGSCEVQPPGHADWAAGALADGAGAAYLSNLWVEGDGRGAGTGTALVDVAHAALHEAGARRMLLHLGATNPFSVPFWARAGYRPLHTTWVRQPAAS